MSATVFGTGDEVNIQQNAQPAAIVLVADGTATAPVTTSGPTMRVSRISENDGTDIFGDGAEVMAALAADNRGTINCVKQVVGVCGMATTWSQTAGVDQDACGLYGVGMTKTDSPGHGIGAFVNGRLESAHPDAGCTGIEVNVLNNSDGDRTYNPTQFTNVVGIWLRCDGLHDSGVGINVGNPVGHQYDVGLAFNGQVAGGKTGGVKNTCIRDDSTAVTFIDMRGIHEYGVRLKNCSEQEVWLDTDAITPKGGIAFGTARDAGIYRSGWAAMATVGSLAVNGGAAIQQVLSGSMTYNPPNLTKLTQAAAVLSVPGAALGDHVIPSFSDNLQGVTLTAYVSSPDVVTAIFFNGTTGNVNLPPATLAALILRRG